MIEPTEDLFKIATGKDVFYTFFVDVGYLIQAEKYPELIGDVELVKNQITKMISLGHDVQLHIHPHWEKAIWKDGEWEMNINGSYKLSDFKLNEIARIVKSYKSYLDKLIGRKTIAFRSGGWCIQPFGKLIDVFKEVGLKIDSSVFQGGYLQTENYSFDFRLAPVKSKYQFEDDVCQEVENGTFTEFPIASFRYNPLFFWRLYILGKIFPSKYKMIGDGEFISQGGRKKQILTSYTTYHVSTDGYYATKLKQGLQKSQNIGHNEMVIIGHPKGNTKDSIKRLDLFVSENCKEHNFTTFDRLNNQNFI
tara:strand:- start:75 stop:995 length:921 start_codon:yes stop_codon:yes gene_type:complete